MPASPPPISTESEDQCFKLCCILDILFSIGDFCFMTFAVWCVQYQEDNTYIYVVLHGILLTVALVVYVGVILSISAPSLNKRFLKAKMVVMPMYFLIIALTFFVAISLIYDGATKYRIGMEHLAEDAKHKKQKPEDDGMFKFSRGYPMRESTNVVSVLASGSVGFLAYGLYLLASYGVLANHRHLLWPEKRKF